MLIMMMALMTGQVDQGIPNFGVDTSRVGHTGNNETYTIVGGQKAADFANAVQSDKEPEHLPQIQCFGSAWGIAQAIEEHKPSNLPRFIRKRLTGVSFCQYQGKDPKFLEYALKSGRMPVVSFYDLNDPYEDLHSAVLRYLDKEYAVVVTKKESLTISRNEFLSRWVGPEGAGFAVVVIPQKIHGGK